AALLLVSLAFFVLALLALGLRLAVVLAFAGAVLALALVLAFALGLAGLLFLAVALLAVGDFLGFLGDLVLVLLQFLVVLPRHLGLGADALLLGDQLFQLLQQPSRLLHLLLVLAPIVLRQKLVALLQISRQLRVVADGLVEHVEVLVRVLGRQRADQGVELAFGVGVAGLLQRLAQSLGLLLVLVAAVLQPACQDGQFLTERLERALQLRLPHGGVAHRDRQIALEALVLVPVVVRFDVRGSDHTEGEARQRESD